MLAQNCWTLNIGYLHTGNRRIGYTQYNARRRSGDLFPSAKLMLGLFSSVNGARGMLDACAIIDTHVSVHLCVCMAWHRYSRNINGSAAKSLFPRWTATVSVSIVRTGHSIEANISHAHTPSGCIFHASSINTRMHCALAHTTKEAMSTIMKRNSEWKHIVLCHWKRCQPNEYIHTKMCNAKLRMKTISHLVGCERKSISFHCTHSHGPQHKGILLISWFLYRMESMLLAHLMHVFLSSSVDVRQLQIACHYARCRVRNDDAEEKVKSERTRYYI